MHGDNYGKLSVLLWHIVVARECYTIVSGISHTASSLDFLERFTEKRDCDHRGHCQQYRASFPPKKSDAA